MINSYNYLYGHQTENPILTLAAVTIIVLGTLYCVIVIVADKIQKRKIRRILKGNK